MWPRLALPHCLGVPEELGGGLTNNGVGAATGGSVEGAVSVLASGGAERPCRVPWGPGGRQQTRDGGREKKDKGRYDRLGVDPRSGLGGLWGAGQAAEQVAGTTAALPCIPSRPAQILGLSVPSCTG